MPSRLAAIAGCALLGAAGGCIPAPHSLEGATCLQNSECGQGLGCFGGVCQDPATYYEGGPGADGGLNPDGGLSQDAGNGLPFSDSFEDGGGNWDIVTGTGTPTFDLVSNPVHGGSFAARITQGGSSTAFSGINHPIPLFLTTTYCADAWINTGTVSPGPVLLGIKMFPSNTYLSMVSIAVDAGVWQHASLPPAVFPSTASTADVRAICGHYAIGQSFYVDDVQVWISLDGGC